MITLYNKVEVEFFVIKWWYNCNMFKNKKKVDKILYENIYTL